jgi:hypothetical protein
MGRNDRMRALGVVRALDVVDIAAAQDDVRSLYRAPCAYGRPVQVAA